jgi:isopenicillin-N N-acyltransferase like protein
MVTNKASLLILLSLLLSACFVTGCGGPASGPVAAPQPETAPMPDEAVAGSGQWTPSEVATRAEETLADSVVSAGTPADHWLFGTSDAADMQPAVLAPEAQRVLVATHGPARLEKVGDDRVLYLKGSHHEMGIQHGTLLKDEIVEAAGVLRAVGTLAWKGNFQVSIADAWERAAPHIPTRFLEEMEGMAEATGLSIEQVREFSIFPELFHCSGFALWGDATADGSLLHGRVLDYMRDAGLDKYACVIVHEPDGGIPFVNVAYTGMLGSVTGMNAEGVVIGEMGGGGAEQWDGMPMTFLVRYCLEESVTLEDTRRIMAETPRTCEYFYCVSDPKAEDGRGSAFGVAAWPDKIEFVGPGEAHALLPRPFADTVLMSSGGRYDCLADRVGKMHGKFTPESALDLMARGVAMKSNMHNALFRPATLDFWVANSTIDAPASNLPYRAYNLGTLMQPPE